SAEFSNETGLLFYTQLAISACTQSNGAVGASNLINQNPANTLAHYLYYNEHRPYVGGSRVDTRLPFGAINRTYTIPIAAELAMVSRAPGAWWLQRYKAGMWRLVWVDATAQPGLLRWRYNELGRTGTISR